MLSTSEGTMQTRESLASLQSLLGKLAISILAKARLSGQTKNGLLAM